MLEPRIVLNATAELNALGQLVISGSDSADTVKLEVNREDQLQLRDGTGDVIPIAGHPGAESDPLDASAVRSGQILIDLRDGDDVLDLQIPSSLSLTVVDGLGIDSTVISFQPPSSPDATRTLEITSDKIRIDPVPGAIELSETQTRLTGNVVIGTAESSSSLRLNSSSLIIHGSLTVAGDTNLSGVNSSVDLSQATLSASAIGNDLRINVDGGSGNQVALGAADDSAGEYVNDLIVDSLQSLRVDADRFEVFNRIAFTNISGTIEVSGDVVSRDIEISAEGSITMMGSITATAGNLSIRSAATIELSGQLDTSAIAGGSIAIDGTLLLVHDLDAVTAGGTVTLNGPTQIDGALRIDSGAQQTAPAGGDIRIAGPINSFLGARQAILTLDARGAAGGAVVVTGLVGEESPLDDITLSGGRVGIDSIAMRSGRLMIDAGTVLLSGSSIVTPGSIDVRGGVTLPAGDFEFVANTLRLHGAISGQTGSRSLSIIASGDVTFDDAVVDFSQLTIESGGVVTFAGPVSLSGDLRVLAAEATIVSASSIQTVGTQRYQGQLSFLVDGILAASSVRLGSATNVRDGMTYTILAETVDDDVMKRGLGTLVFSSSSRIGGSATIDEGTLRVDGQFIDPVASVRLNGGDLEGIGRIEGAVVAIQAGAIRPGSPVGQLTVGSLLMLPSTEATFQLSGPVPGAGYDQIVVDPQGSAADVRLGGALLELEFVSPAQAATEYVLVVNQSSTAIGGRFTFGHTATGERLATPRVLGEGDLVLDNFGGANRSAYITYAGGDGNDVAIVTSGDVNFEAGNATLIQRRGSNLEIRTGNNLEAAQSAIPVVRPIAAVNDHQVRIDGSLADQSLFLDVDNFVDPAAGAIQFQGHIRFSGGGPGDTDSITLLDLNPASNDSFDSVRYLVDTVDSGNLRITTRGEVSQFDIQFVQTESITQAVVAETIEFQFADLDDRIEIAADPASPARTLVTSSVDAQQSLTISIENPTVDWSIRSGGGNDAMLIVGFGGGGGGFAASLTLDGETGDDSIIVQTDLTLGRGDGSAAYTASAEAITIDGNITTTGGSVDGQVLLTGGESITLTQSSTIQSGTAVIVVNAAGGRFDSGGGSLISGNNQTAVLIENASGVQLGNVEALQGQLRIETDSLAGEISQAAGTRVGADRLVIDSLGAVALGNPGNGFRLIERVQAAGTVTITDSLADLDVQRIDAIGNDVSLVTPGILGLSAGSIVADGAIVNLTAGISIIKLHSVDALPVMVATGTVNLRSGAGGIGLAGSPIVVAATKAINADASGTGSDMHLKSPIAMPIGLINAGSGSVFLDALSIQDAGDDDLDDIVSGRLNMSSQTGIGSEKKLELQAITELAATTTTGGIELDHSSAGNLTVQSLVTGSGPIKLTHSGSELLTIQRIDSGRGDIFVTHQDGLVRIVGGGSADPAILARSGSVTVTAMGDVSDMALEAPATSHAGNMTLTAGRDLLLNAPATSQAGNMTLTAGRDLLLKAPVTSQIGNVLLTAGRDLRLESQLQTSDGSIQVHAVNRMIVIEDQNVDAEILAEGIRSQVVLTSDASIELVGSVKVEASRIEEETIRITAPSIVLSPNIQLVTGNGVGVARWFSPRPMPGLTDTAFFDFTTIDTSQLIQSGDNNAKGTFSVLIGRPGENGFTIDIDWGDSRPTVEHNLPGDQRFVETHVYTEADILRSRLNGRTSATDPLQVRFSVRHHESIVVRGDMISQSAAAGEMGAVEVVAGGLVSSTDNPVSGSLRENGIASFNIPNLAISVPFFQVRQIIPEVIQPESFIRVQLPQLLTYQRVDTETTSVAPAVSRDEYLQLRVLSLEPGGEDVAAPQRLPEDILAGDNLQQLFAKLPDGRYEIQYVVGDGNERTLLRFDLRNHEPVVPGEELDGSRIELKAIDLNSILRELQDQSSPLDPESSPAGSAPAPTLPPQSPAGSRIGNPLESGADEQAGRSDAALVVAGTAVTASTIYGRSRRLESHAVPHPFSVAGRFLSRRRCPR